MSILKNMLKFISWPIYRLNVVNYRDFLVFWPRENGLPSHEYFNENEFEDV